MRRKINLFPCLHLFLLLCAVAAANFYFHSYFTRILLTLLIIVPVCSIGIAYTSLKKLYIPQQSVLMNTIRGQHVALRFPLRNKMPFPIIQLKVVIKEENIFAHQMETDRERNIILFPRQKFFFSHTPDASVCGMVKVTLSSLTLSDYFGLITLKRTIHATGHLQVFPQNQEYTGQQMIPFRQMNADDISQIRDYLPGDRLNLIHWKLTAKKDSLMVKELSEATEHSLIIGIELFDNPEHIINKILDQAYSLAYFCISSGQFPTITWWNMTEQTQEFQTPTTMDELQDCFSSILCAETYTQLHLLPGDTSLPMILINENGEFEFDEAIYF